MFRTIKQKQFGESGRFIGQTGGGNGCYGVFGHSVSSCIEGKGVEIVLDANPGPEVDLYFPDIKRGIETEDQAYTKYDGIRICSVRVEIIWVKTHPVDTSDRAWLRAGYNFVEMMKRSALPIDFHPDWRTTTVLELANGIQFHQDFDGTPILADALQEAGCNNEEILNHCRLCKDHRGKCWVVDLILDQV